MVQDQVLRNRPRISANDVVLRTQCDLTKSDMGLILAAHKDTTIAVSGGNDIDVKEECKVYLTRTHPPPH